MPHRSPDMERPVKYPSGVLWSWSVKVQAQADSGGGSDLRRLITLIYVDRVWALAIMVVIRRELPCD
jgi:hypothetical protein